MPDISALHIYDSSAHNSMLNESSHLNLDEFMSPETLKHNPSKTSQRLLPQQSLGQTAKAAGDRTTGGPHPNISNIFDKINELCRTGDPKTTNPDSSLENLSGKVRDIRALFSQASAQIHQVAGSETLEAQVQKSQRELEELSEKVEALKRDRERTRQSLAVTNELIHDKTTELSDLTSKKSALALELKQAEDSLSAKHRQIGDLQISTMKMQRSVEDSRAALAHKTSELEDLVAKKEALSQRIEDIQNKSSDVELELSEVRKQLFELEAIRKLSEEEKNVKEDELMVFRKRLVMLEAQKKNLENQMKELGGLWEEGRTKLGAANTELATVQAEILRLTNTNRALQKAVGDAEKEADGLKIQVAAEKGRCDGLRKKLKEGLARIENASRTVESSEVGLDLLAVCGEFVAQVESAISEVDNGGCSPELRKNVEAELPVLKVKVLDALGAAQVAKARRQASQEVWGDLSVELDRLKDGNPTEKEIGETTDFETLKNDFIDAIWQKLTALKRLSEQKSTNGAQDAQISDLRAFLEGWRGGGSHRSHVSIQSADGLDALTASHTFSRRVSLPNTSGDLQPVDRATQEGSRPELTESVGPQFYRKHLPENTSESKVPPKGPVTPIKEGGSATKRDFSDVDQLWNAIVKEMGNLIQFITKGSSLFANTVSFLLGKLPKDRYESQGVRSTVIK